MRERSQGQGGVHAGELPARAATAISRSGRVDQDAVGGLCAPSTGAPHRPYRARAATRGRSISNNSSADREIEARFSVIPGVGQSHDQKEHRNG